VDVTVEDPERAVRHGSPPCAGTVTPAPFVVKGPEGCYLISS
jgi:hypothetical protein